MKIKSIYINSDEYIFRTLEVQDFFNVEEENDFNIFEIKKPLTMYEKILKDLKQEKTNQGEKDLFYEKIIKKILKICLINCPESLYDESDENSQNIQLFLFNNIIISSLQIFKIPPEIDMHFALVVDKIAQRYGTQPIDILYKQNEYNKLDAFLFNKEICSIAMQKEIDDLKNYNLKK